MIDFRRREFVPASLIALSAVLVMAATLLFMLFYPRPTTRGLAEESRAKKLRARLKTKEDQERLGVATTAVNANTWPGNPETVGPAALARLNGLAARRQVKVTQFRPQRTTEAGEFTTLPFLVTLEGSFPQIVQFARDIDTPGTRLTVNLLQISAATDENGQVSATMGVVAYLKPKDEVPAPTNSRRTTNRA